MEAGRTILKIKVKNAAHEKVVPLSSKYVEVRTIRLAGIGTTTCSRIHPKNTAHETLIVINPWIMLIKFENI
jgi:hypothetical protein